jgi:signal transduction histidine kinase
MSSVHAKFTPKRTLLGLMLGSLFFATIAYDYSSRTRIRDILLSSIYSSNVLVQSNNFQLLAINLQSLKNFNPFVESLGIYVSGERRTGSGESPKEIRLTEPLMPDFVKISLSGFFTYKAYYSFSNTQNLLYGSFAEPNRIWVLMLIYLIIILFFAMIYWITVFLDLDRIQEQALKYALSLSGRTLHGLKTHMIHANRLYQILTQGKFTLTDEQRVIIKDFDLSRVEMDGHMSIMRLDNFKTCREKIDLESNLMRLVEVYQRSGIGFEIKCKHHSKFPVDADILTATAGNIIKNAFDFSDQRVWITTEEYSGKIRITVSNTGKRISKKDLIELSKSSYTGGHGTGLGLHICRAWMNKLGGTFELDSNAGATVAEITFPLTVPNTRSFSGVSNSNHIQVSLSKEIEPHVTPHENPTHQVTSTPSNQAQEICIAVIDDVASFRMTLANQLKKLNVNCETFDSLASFLDQIEKDPIAFHAVIVDRHLRGENAVRDRFPDSCKYLGFKGSVILYSCDPSETHNPKAKHGFDLLLPKDDEVDWHWVVQEVKKKIDV